MSELPDKPTQTIELPTRGRATVIQKDGVQETDRVLKEFEKFATQQIADPFADQYTAGAGGEFTIIQPQYDPWELAKLPIYNNTLLQCIAAMIVNIEGFGWTPEFKGKDEQKNGKAAKEELQFLTDLLNHANENESFSDVRKKLRLDYEAIGYAYLEIGRDRDTSNVSFMAHIPAQTMRMTKMEDVFTPYSFWLPRDGKLVEIKSRKRFRRFVQMVGHKRMYFKECGDPRIIDPETGRENKALTQAQAANEVIMLNQYWGSDVYGLPRHINQIPALLGSRKSEIINLQYFDDNCIPAMAVLVSGGYLTEESVLALKKAFSQKGASVQNKVLVLEALSPENTNMFDDNGRRSVPRLEFKPLAAERQNDQLFTEYDKTNRDKVRSAFRLPPIVLGLSEDYTRATAESSLGMAETQVFAPEREAIDNIINMQLLRRDSKPLEFWKVVSNPSRIVSTETLTELMERMQEAGALTPNIAIEMSNQLIGSKRPKIEESWGDLPMPIVMKLLNAGQLKLNKDGRIEFVETVEPKPGDDDPNNLDDPEAKDKVVVEDKPARTRAKKIEK